MVDTVCSNREMIRIAGDDYPAEVVKSRFLKLNSSHIEYVLDRMRENTTYVRNIKKYLLAALYNAPATIDSYYTILSVILEWKHPIRGWKTESDLWHHPRKYLVPLIMLLIASFVGTWTVALWICTAVLLMECCIFLFMTRRA